MEITFDNNNSIKPKLSVVNDRLNKNIQTKQSFRTDTNNSNQIIHYIPETTDSMIINTFSLNDLIKNNINNKKITKETEKKKRKGTLHKYINSSYFKKSFGSIPSKSEKILLPDQKVNDRFSGSNSVFSQINENTPGVGSYNINYDWNLKNKSVVMETEEKRFPDSYNFLPGVGDYNLDKGLKYQQKKDNLRYNSLYCRTKTLLNDNLYKNKSNNLGAYNPQNLKDNERNKKNYNFSSYSGRDDYRGSKIPTLFDKANLFPGPGQYFNNINNNLLEKKNLFNIKYKDKNNTENFNSRNIKKFLGECLNDIKVSGDKSSFNMKQNGNIRDNKLYNFEDIHKLNESKKIKVVNKNEELEKKLRENEKNHTSHKLDFNIKQKMELDRIKTILGNDNGKPDYFYLSPDRWKNKKSIFKVPGPAYYFY